MKYKVIYGFDALAEEFNLKPKRKVQKDWAKPKQESFCKCPNCGKYMNWISDTNTMVCNNEIYDKETKETKVCGFIRLLDEGSVSYGRYIFSNGDHIDRDNH